MSIEGIALGHFSVTTHPETVSVPEPRTYHDMFHSFLYDDRKNIIYNNSCTQQTQNYIFKATKNSVFKVGYTMGKTGGCVEQYRCATDFFVFYVVTILLCYYCP